VFTFKQTSLTSFLVFLIYSCDFNLKFITNANNFLTFVHMLHIEFRNTHKSSQNIIDSENCSKKDRFLWQYLQLRCLLETSQYDVVEGKQQYHNQ